MNPRRPRGSCLSHRKGYRGPSHTFPNLISDPCALEELKLLVTLLKELLKQEALPRDNHLTGHQNLNQTSQNKTLVAKCHVSRRPKGSTAKPLGTYFHLKTNH